MTQLFVQHRAAVLRPSPNRHTSGREREMRREDSQRGRTHGSKTLHRARIPFPARLDGGVIGDPTALGRTSQGGDLPLGAKLPQFANRAGDTSFPRRREGLMDGGDSRIKCPLLFFPRLNGSLAFLGERGEETRGIVCVSPGSLFSQLEAFTKATASGVRGAGLPGANKQGRLQALPGEGGGESFQAKQPQMQAGGLCPGPRP